MYWKILGALVLLLCGFILDLSNKIEQKHVYNKCLKGYNYHSLDKRISTVTHKASVQRLQARKVEVTQICKIKKQEYTSLWVIEKIEN